MVGSAPSSKEFHMSVNAVDKERINDLASALVIATPERFKTIDCLVTQVETQCSGRYRYKITCQDFPEEVITEPTEKLHQAAYEAISAVSAEWLEVKMVEKDGGWSFSFDTSRLDGEDGKERKKVHDDAIWQKVYDEREEFFEKNFGPIPTDIQKLMTVLWPGGGIWDFEKSSISGKRVLVSCGLSNPDMPGGAKVAEFERVDTQDGNKTFNTKLARTIPRYVPPEWSGYGYEVAVIADHSDNRAMGVLTWIVEGELNHDGNYFGLLQKYGGLTVQDMGLFDGSKSDFLFYQAIDPIPASVPLSSGLMQLVIATSITRAERDFAKEKGCSELVKRLFSAGVGQVTDFNRKSVV
jgi:Suppressor of fused protein (SUFU)